MLHLLCMLFLSFSHHLHLRSLGVRSRRLGTPALKAHGVQYSHHLGETPPFVVGLFRFDVFTLVTQSLAFLGQRDLVSLVKSPIMSTGERRDSNPGPTPKCLNDKHKHV